MTVEMTIQSSMSIVTLRHNKHKHEYIVKEHLTSNNKLTNGIGNLY